MPFSEVVTVVTWLEGLAKFLGTSASNAAEHKVGIGRMRETFTARSR
jgi:hypothetical protein